jgi:D-glycero-D-manno-heptose 1,7-bisphosphate phosphatase
VTRVPVDAVLCDRDGTLIVDVPYNGDPTLVEPMATVPRALARLRAAGVPVAVVSNQSGIARGDFGRLELERVMRRLDDLLGPFEAIVWCPHGPDDGCPCRKPAPGLVHDAARRLGVAPERCAVIGDTAADVEAARRSGAWGILVPNERTLPAEVEAAPFVAATFAAAVDLVLASEA